LSDLAHERLQVLDFEQSIYKPERGFHEIGALEHGYVGIIFGCTVQRIRSFWRFEGRERAGLRFWEGQGSLDSTSTHSAGQGVTQKPRAFD
jgi:hypothetical protein